MMNSITINELEVETVIGAFAWEQQVKQRLTIDLCYQVSDDAFKTNDVLTDAYDYGRICSLIRDFVEGQKTKLLETLGQNLRDFLHQECQLNDFTLSIHKPACVKGVKRVSLTMTQAS